MQPDQAEDRSDVGNSVVALISFMRVGQDLRTGEYAENLRKGVEYVFSTMEKCNDETLFVTHVRDTQLQSKIGRYVDTFLAAQLLAELKGQMLTPEAEERRANLLDAVVVKIGKHQGKDGAFAGNAGWASVLSQGLCSRSLNAARLAGAKVSDEMLETIAVVGERHEIAAKLIERMRGIADGGSLTCNRAPDPGHWRREVADFRRLVEAGEADRQS